MDNKFPLELGHLYFTRSIVVALPEHASKKDEFVNMQPENNIIVTKVPDNERAQTEKQEYAVTMRTVLNKEKSPLFPYLIDMECMALFFVDSALSDEEAHKGVTITGHSVTYGAIREAVSWITSRQPYGQIPLGLSILKGKENKDSNSEE